MWGLLCGLIASAAEPVPLVVGVRGAPSEEGQIVLRVYCERADWLDAEAACHTLRAPVQPELTELELELEPGRYALTAFHDADGDGQMRTAWPIPLPRDPVAISNNHQPRFGPPRYEAAAFRIEGEPVRQDLQLVLP